MPVRRRIERTYRAIWSQDSSVRITVPPVDRAGPSLLIPVSRPWLLTSQQEQGINADLLFSDLVIPGTFNRCMRCPPELYDTPLLAQMIVVLDRAYIAGVFLPALTERYFPVVESLDYHELRTPLAVICSAGENLADEVVHDPHKARQYGAVISN